jgi:hypothetical protein
MNENNHGFNGLKEHEEFYYNGLNGFHGLKEHGDI